MDNRENVSLFNKIIGNLSLIPAANFVTSIIRCDGDSARVVMPMQLSRFFGWLAMAIGQPA